MTGDEYKVIIAGCCCNKGLGFGYCKTGKNYHDCDRDPRTCKQYSPRPCGTVFTPENDKWLASRAGPDPREPKKPAKVAK